MMTLDLKKLLGNVKHETCVLWKYKLDLLSKSVMRNVKCECFRQILFKTKR